MNQQGLDEIDRRILDLIRDNARLRYSEIGQMVGISRVSVRNRMEQMEKSGVIRGYRTVMDQTMVPQGSRFFLDLETDPEKYEDILERLAASSLLRRIYGISGQSRIHAEGFAPNQSQLNFFANNLLRTAKGIRSIRWSTVIATYKDMDGGVEYVRYQEPEHLDN